MLDRQLETSNHKRRIMLAKLALEAARRVGDALHVELAENSLNDLLDRYHTYHTSHGKDSQ